MFWSLAWLGAKTDIQAATLGCKYKARTWQVGSCLYHLVTRS